MSKYRKKRTVGTYFRLVALTGMISIVSALVAVAILNRGGLIILAYTIFVGIVLCIIGCRR